MDGFLRPDTPLLCFYPLPPWCVGDGFSLGLYCLLRDVLHSPHSYSVRFATRLIRICNVMKNLYM